MHSLLGISLFPFFSILLQNTVVKTLDVQSIIKDFTGFNISCTDDNCQDYQEDSLSTRACHCGIHCAQLGTCCFDSPYIDVPEPELKPSCGYVYDTGYYFLVNNCPSTDSVWAGLCNNKLSEDDDVQELVPVISLLTNITYKNYYCFRCYEETDEFLYWTLQVKSTYALPTTPGEGSKELDRNVSVIYDKTKDTIMASYDDKISNFSVKLSLQFPSETKNVTHICEPDVVSNCSDEWPDNEIRNKCLSYMSLKDVEVRSGAFFKYKNLHCALCNYKNLTDVHCRKEYGYGSKKDGGYSGGHRGGYGGGRLGGHRGGHRGGGHRFTFTYLLDINRSDGELVGKIERCSDYHIWDRFSKKCRKIVCAIPGFKVKNWKCVQE